MYTSKKPIFLIIFLSIAFHQAAAEKLYSKRSELINKMIDDYSHDCKKFTEKKGFEKHIDLNRDGIKDYIFDYSNAECDSSSSDFCGSAGCIVSIVLSINQHEFKTIWDNNIQDYELGQMNGHYFILMHNHGTYCNQPGYKVCNMKYVFTQDGIKKVLLHR